jgi:uncharacterized iron-regulated membrane protein
LKKSLNANSWLGQVSKQAADDLVAWIRETHPEAALIYSVQPGDHGFDVAHTLEKPWVMEGVEFAKKYW